MFYRKQKLTGLLQTFFTFLLQVLFCAFYRVRSSKYVLPVHPKLIFWCGLKKALMVAEDRFYQIFAKIYPSPLVLKLHIYSYPHI